MKSDVFSFVDCLLMPSRPPTILWAIVSVVVFSVQGFVFGSNSHILKKVGEIEPPRAYRNPAFSIVLPRFIRWFSAPRNHRNPTVISLGRPFPASVTMIPLDLRNPENVLFKFVTSAGFCIPRLEACKRSCELSPASAFTNDHPVISSIWKEGPWSLFKNCNSTETQTRSRLDFRHDIDNRNVVFSSAGSVTAEPHCESTVRKPLGQ